MCNPILVSKKNGDIISVIKIKNLNGFISNILTKVEVSHLIKKIPKEKDCMCDKNLKDPYFCVPFIKNIERISIFSGKISYSNAFKFVLVQNELVVFLQN